MSEKNTQGVPSSSHDIKHDESGPTKVPDPSHIEQGSKPPELRDKADKAEHPTPRK